MEVFCCTESAGKSVRVNVVKKVLELTHDTTFLTQMGP
jgi:hypothetical protein